MRILVVEDDSAIAEGLCAGLRDSGHAVDHLADGRQARVALEERTHDLLVLDLGLPYLSGDRLLQELRKQQNPLAVFIVTARDSMEERIRVLDLGADDYLVKPFAYAEFAARVRALLRRQVAHGRPEMLLGRLRLDIAGRRGWVGDRELELTAREFGLLSALAARQERLTSRSQLIEAVCDWNEELTDNGLDIAVHRLRRKLENSGASVRTVRGLGYILKVDDKAA
ncbi:response regulator [Salinisphaera hydrothermalis]|uniref:Response regulator n=1 Tax=Salinisphaera hydrothermalis (strain C41B8) TaxID=1304275 RepID=A0A084IMM6_SALHC|nr:response regulator transcription factor [Salinisphaera hydrothermalis]KEZ77960.1 response regulator [Salinisphaera hydrothermalis C41B8]